MSDDGDDGGMNLTVPGLTAGDAVVGDDDELDNGGVKILPDSDVESEEEEEEEEEEESVKGKAERKEKEKKKKEEKEKREKERQKSWNETKIQLPHVPFVPIYSKTFVASPSAAIEMREFPGAEKCRGGMLVNGFPSKGLASLLVAKTLIEELHLPLIGELAARGFTSACRVHHGRVLHASRIYGNEQLVVFTSELLIESEIAHPVSQAIIDFAQRHQINTIVCPESLALEVELDLDDEDNVDQESVIKKILQSMKTQEEQKREKEDKHHKLHGTKAPPHKKPAAKDGKDSKDAKKGSKSSTHLTEKEAAAAAASLAGTENNDDDGWVDEDDEDNTKLVKKLSSKNNGELKDLSRKQEAESVTGSEPVLYVCTSSTDDELLQKMGLNRIKNAIIAGVTGLVLCEAPYSSVDAICLVGRYHPLLSDARAAVAVLDVIAQLAFQKHQLKFEYHKLVGRAERVETRIKKSLTKITKKSDAKKAPPGMYS